MKLTLKPDEALGALLSEDIYDPGRLDAEGVPILLGKRGDKISPEMLRAFEKAGIEFVTTNQGLLVVNSITDRQVRKWPQGLWPSENIVINGRTFETKYSLLGQGGKGRTLDRWWRSFSEHGCTGFVSRYS